MTNGFCNCNECTESNNSLVVDVTLSEVYCPKETRYPQVLLQVLQLLPSRYCFEAGREPDNYTEERRQLCQVHCAKCTVPGTCLTVPGGHLPDLQGHVPGPAQLPQHALKVSV